MKMDLPYFLFKKNMMAVSIPRSPPKAFGVQLLTSNFQPTSPYTSSRNKPDKPLK